MIDKIDHTNKIGIDICENLIELLKYAQNNELPITITEYEYSKVKSNKDAYEKWYIGLVGFCGSFGAKYFGGFARRYNKDGTLFDVPKQAINSLRKQSKLDNFKNIKFKCMSYLDLPKEKIKNSVIYCDPPYFNTTKYKTDFNHEEFYKWCVEMSKDNIVLISEYYMPEDSFECVWSKELSTSLGSGINKCSDKKRIEKLFKVKSV